MDERLRVPGPRPDRGAESQPAHGLTITGRQQISVTGVLHVESFDDREIILDTHLGSLILRGEDLHIKQLDLDSGSFSVQGMVNSCVYGPPLRNREGGRARGKGLFERLLR